MTSRRILMGALAVIVCGTVFGKSPYSIGLKLKYGTNRKDRFMLLDASNQLLKFRSDDQLALQEAVDIKLKVAEREVDAAARIINSLITKYPDNPRLFITHARINIMRGDFDQALTDLVTAKEITLRGSLRNEFTPSPALIDDMIEGVRNRARHSDLSPVIVKDKAEAEGLKRK
jgi:hypothetical protein